MSFRATQPSDAHLGGIRFLPHTGVCEKTHILQERLPCKPSAETAFQPLI